MAFDFQFCLTKIQNFDTISKFYVATHGATASSFQPLSASSLYIKAQLRWSARNCANIIRSFSVFRSERRGRHNMEAVFVRLENEP